MAKTSIEWSDNVWNPVSGCTRVSAGCDNCYAVTMTKRLEAMGQEKYAGLVNIGKGHFNGTARCHEDALTIPLKAKKPRRWFVNSMSDLFHREVPFEFIDKVFAVMALTPHHTYQILTKRPERMAEYFAHRYHRWEDKAWINRAHQVADALMAQAGDSKLVHELRYGINERWPLANCWLGTSVEDQATADERIPHLLRCPAAVRFLSCEPLLGPVSLCPGCPGCPTDCGWIPCRGFQVEPGVMSGCRGGADCPQCHGAGTGIHWVIVGGESGPGARPMHPYWARSLRDQCVAASVPFFFKQWGEWLPGHHYTDEHRKSDPCCTSSRFQCAQRVGSGWSIGYPLALEVDDEDALYRVGKKKAGRILDGRTWDEFPEVVR